MVERAKDVEQLMTEFEDKFGFVRGNLERNISKFAKNPDAVNMLNQMKRLVADMRNDISGSDVTENEEDFLRELIPDLGEPVDNARVKVTNMKTDTLRRLNSYRSTLRLPPLDENTLIDVRMRESLY